MIFIKILVFEYIIRRHILDFQIVWSLTNERKEKKQSDDCPRNKYSRLIMIGDNWSNPEKPNRLFYQLNILNSKYL